MCTVVTLHRLSQFFHCKITAMAASLQDLQGLMGQLTLNVTGLTASSQKLHDQMEATQDAQEKSEAQLQKLSTQVAEQGQTLERLSTQMVGYSAGTNSPPQVGDVTMKYTGLDNNASLMDKHITGQQCAQLIQHALTEQVVPVVKHINHRLTDVEMELKKLKIRTAWVEKDTLYTQVENAKVTLIARGWPGGLTVEDRQRVITDAMKKAGVDSNWQTVYTATFLNAENKNEMALHTVVKFWTMADKQKFTGYYQEPGYGTVIACTEWREVDKEGDTGGKEWKVVEVKERIKLAPTVTQFERRLTAPMHELMNALSTAFPLRFKGRSLKPHWKTLVLTDPGTGAWMGQLRYVRSQAALNMSTGSPTDWKCEILLPQEIYEKTMQAWCDGWYSQLRKQFEQTESEDAIIHEASQSTAADYSKAQRITTLLKTSKPQWDAQEEQGIANFTARFKWEFPWEVVFEAVPKDSPLRTAWAELPTVEQLMDAMAQTTTEGGGLAAAEIPVPEGTEGLDVRNQVMHGVSEKSTAKKREASTEGTDAPPKKQPGTAGTGASSASSQGAVATGDTDKAMDE